MKTEDAVAHFGSTRKVAELLGITTQAIYKWDGCVPKLRAYQLARLSHGALHVEDVFPNPPDPRGRKPYHRRRATNEARDDG